MHLFWSSASQTNEVIPQSQPVPGSRPDNSVNGENESHSQLPVYQLRLIEIHSDYPDAKILYSLDGTKPA